MRRKMWGHRVLVSGLLALYILTAAGCGKGSVPEIADSMSNMVEPQAAIAENGYEMTAEEAGESGTVEVSENGAESQSERKLIKTVEISVETREFDSTLTLLEEQIAGLGGYIENRSTYHGSAYSDHRSDRSASITVRVPEERLQEFLGAVSAVSNVIRSEEYVKDVTLAYVDLESHKEALLTEQERLMELLSQAGSIEDIIALEERLSSVRYQLESMESQLRTYDDQIDYSTVYLEISEVQELTPVQEGGFFKRIADGFVDSLQGLGRGIQELVIWVLAKSPYLAVWAAVIVLIVFGFKKWRKKKKG